LVGAEEGGGDVFLSETGQSESPKVMQRVNKWGNKMRYESPITKLSLLLSPTHALRERERPREREKGKREGRRASASVCVVRSRMCVL
jgi:hypothetical protein